MTSPKELALNKKIMKQLDGRPKELFELLIRDEEIAVMQDYANIVSIQRLGFNDHGPVHMRTVTSNAIRLLELFHDAGIQTNFEKEKVGTYEDSMLGVILSSFLHDIGMSISRAYHERSGAALATPIIERILKLLLPNDFRKRIVIRSLAYEGIIGHMGTQRIHSLEAGTVLVADGCDMKKGRSRIPMIMQTESRVGDIHKYSSSAIEAVRILAGEKRPIRIEIDMSASVGFFQVEEVLMQKIKASPIKPYIELQAQVIGREAKCYMGD